MFVHMSFCQLVANQKHFYQIKRGESNATNVSQGCADKITMDDDLKRKPNGGGTGSKRQKTIHCVTP